MGLSQEEHARLPTRLSLARTEGRAFCGIDWKEINMLHQAERKQFIPCAKMKDSAGVLCDGRPPQVRGEGWQCLQAEPGLFKDSWQDPPHGDKAPRLWGEPMKTLSAEEAQEQEKKKTPKECTRELIKTRADYVARKQSQPKSQGNRDKSRPYFCLFVHFFMKSLI